MKTLLFAILFLLSRAVPFGLQLLDRRRWLGEAQRARAWNTATWGVGVFWFGILTMLPWVWVTRLEWGAWRRKGIGFALLRSAGLLLAGAAVTVVVAFLVDGVIEALAAALGVKPDFFGG